MNISGKIALIKEKIKSGNYDDDLLSLVDGIDEEVSVMLAEINILTIHKNKGLNFNARSNAKSKV